MTKTRHSVKRGDRVTFNGKPYTVTRVARNSFTIASADGTDIVGVHLDHPALVVLPK